MQKVRALVRWILVAVCVGMVLTISFGVIGELFIEAAKEKGWYDNPSAKLDAAVTAVSAFVTQKWMLAAAAFVLGLTAGVWLDALLRRLVRGRLHGDPEVVRIRSSLGRLMRMLNNFEDPKKQASAVTEIANNSERSDHDMWLDERMEKYRHEFLFAVRYAQALREAWGPKYKSAEQKKFAAGYLSTAFDKIERRISEIL